MGFVLKAYSDHISEVPLIISAATQLHNYCVDNEAQRNLFFGDVLSKKDRSRGIQNLVVRFISSANSIENNSRTKEGFRGE